MLDEKALKAIDKVELLAREKLKEFMANRDAYGIAHDKDYQMLAAVPNWAKHVKENHANPYSKSTVEGCLQNLRQVVRRFKFNLKDE